MPVCTNRSAGTNGKFIDIFLSTNRSAGTNGIFPIIALGRICIAVAESYGNAGKYHDNPEGVELK
jgi:hypothetical protein